MQVGRDYVRAEVEHPDVEGEVERERAMGELRVEIAEVEAGPCVAARTDRAERASCRWSHE